jgi:HPt (histidine-containing phosphotransfer) domain-containing protein
MVDTFKDLGSRLRTADGEMTKAGKAAMFLGKGIAAIGAAQAAGAVINELSDSAGNLERKLQGVIIATRDTSEELVDAFGKLAGAQDKDFDLKNIWEDFGKEVKLAGTDAKRNIEDLDAAFDRLMKSAPDQAATFIEALKDTTDELDHNSGQYEDNIMLIERWSERLGLANDAAAVLGGETLPAMSTGFANAEAAAAAGADELALYVASLEDVGDEAHIASDRIADLQTNFSNLKDEIQMEDDWLSLREQLDQTKLAGVEAFQAVEDKSVEAGAKQNDFTHKVNATALEILNMAEQIDNIPESVESEIKAAVEKGDLERAWELLSYIKAENGKTYRTYTVNTVTSGGPGYNPNPGTKRVPGTAMGGNRTGMTWVGERGPEIVDLPLGSHVRSFPQLRADLSGASGGSTASVNYSITVNVAPGGDPASTGRALVEAIQDYERVNSSRWRAS